MTIHVVGASGRSGMAFCRSLAADGVTFAPVVRNPGKWRATGLPNEPMVADLDHPQQLRQMLKRAEIVVSCVHARHAKAIMDASGACHRFVFLGSTRKFSRWPDDHGSGVQEGEAAFRESDRCGVMLHPTMIYGAEGEDNVQRLARLLRKLPLVPLPDGGRSLLRPIHQDDVTRAMRVAADTAWHRRESVVIAGQDRVSYADFVRAVAAAAGLPPPRIVSLPVGVLRAVSPLTWVLPGVPRVRRAELQRLTEDKTFGIEAMQRLLGVVPIGLAEGLARTFAGC